jgi:hypothetical protein
MASIGLPQELRHPSYLSIDLYSTPLNLRFVSARKPADDDRKALLNCSQPEAAAQKVTRHGGFGLQSNGGAGNVGYRCVAYSSSPAEDMFAGVNNRISATNQGGPHEGTKVW